MLLIPNSVPRRDGMRLYTWESLEKHELALANSFGKKENKPSLIVVVTPTTTKIGDDYFLSKLHKAVCIKWKSVYFVPTCLGKGVVSGWSFAHLWSVISECSFWLLPHPETSWTHIYVWSLYEVLP